MHYAFRNNARIGSASIILTVALAISRVDTNTNTENMELDLSHLSLCSFSTRAIFSSLDPTSPRFSVSSFFRSSLESAIRHYSSTQTISDSILLRSP